MLVSRDQNNPVWIAVFDSEANSYELFRITKGFFFTGMKTGLRIYIGNDSRIVCDGGNMKAGLCLDLSAESKLSDNLTAKVVRKKQDALKWLRQKIGVERDVPRMLGQCQPRCG